MSPAPTSKIARTSCSVLAGPSLFFLGNLEREARLGVVANWKNCNLLLLGSPVALAAVALRGEDADTTNWFTL